LKGGLRNGRVKGMGGWCVRYGVIGG
jgi:hypothetical protein